MSENTNILVSVTRKTIETYKQQDGFPGNVPSIGSVFSECADMKLVGEDAKWSARFSVPAGMKQEIKEAVREKGFIAEDDYSLHILK